MTQSNAIPNSTSYEFKEDSITKEIVETSEPRIDWDTEGEAAFLRSHDLLLKPAVPVVGGSKIGSKKALGLFDASPVKLQSPSDLAIEAAKEQWNKFRNWWS